MIVFLFFLLFSISLSIWFIELPAAILQSRFFSDEHPRYLNYGAIGFIIGHELTHGFDDEGRQYDLDGNLVDWWQNTTKHHFLQRAKCIIEQYGNYTDPATNMTVGLFIFKSLYLIYVGN